MKLTQDHVRYWEERQRAPAWVETFRGTRPQGRLTVSIDRIVNLNAGFLTRKQDRLDAVNLVSLIGLARKRGEHIDLLRRVAVNPGCLINPKRRAAYAKKWLRRIESKGPNQ